MSAIKIRVDGKLFPIEAFTFSGGEEHVSLKNVPFGQNIGTIGSGNVEIIARLQSAKALMQLLLVTEVLNRLGEHTQKHLIIPYFPYARQDRVTVSTEAFSLQCLATLLNIPIYSKIITYDLHSPVAFQYMKKLQEVKQVELVTAHPGIINFVRETQPILLAPDKGALGKSQCLASVMGLPLIHADKTRQVTDGKITRHHIESLNFVKGHSVLICDDICDGGKTFIGLGQQLKEAGANRVGLYVTHGIFSKGYAVFNGAIDRIFTTDTFIAAEQPLPDQVPVFIHRVIKD